MCSVPGRWARRIRWAVSTRGPLRDGRRAGGGVTDSARSSTTLGGVSELVPVLSGVAALTLLITVSRGLRWRSLQRSYVRRLQEQDAPRT